MAKKLLIPKAHVRFFSHEKNCFDEFVTISESWENRVIFTRSVKLSSLVIKSVCDFMSNHPSNGAIIQVAWPVIGEKYALQNSGGKLNGIF